jgi:phenylalanyl-tRNA synthetase beta chain
MLIPLSWLKEFVDIHEPAEVIAERLTVSGLEVGYIRYIGIPQQTIAGIRQPKSDHLVWDRDKLVLGAIREIKPHPNADKLVLAMVDYGANELEQCVTGAPNLREFLGKGELNPPLWTAFAKEGAVVYDGHSEETKLMTLKGKELRGIYNKSMVCSEKELGITDEHEGVILLDHDAKYVAGMPLQDVLGDVIFNVELTPNLGHCWSVLGVAREIAALFNVPLRQPSYDFVAEGTSITGQADIEITHAELNPRFTLTLLKNTQVKPSPKWMQYRLRLVGQRPINNMVDVTNYITFEIGQPLHAYDYDKLVQRAKGNAPKLITRLPKDGETLETLDGSQRPLGANQILVCDDKGVLGLGGVMGGAETEISDSTTAVLLEAAAWNFINIRKTQQAQKLFTEAGVRFSRNIHPSRAILGSSRGIELMRQLGGGQVAQGVIDHYPLPPEVVRVSLPVSEVKRLLGMDLDVHTVADLLRREQFEVTIQNDVLEVIVPNYRTDISTGVVGQADLVEEVARVIGYDQIPTTPMADIMPKQRTNAMFEFQERLRDVCVALGLSENISYRFTHPEAEAKLVPVGQASSLPTAGYVTMANPIAPEKSVLRHTLLISLLENAVNNARYQTRQQVFEVGNVYLQGELALPDEPLRLGILLTGARHDNDWTGSNSRDNVDFFDMKGVIEGVLHGLHLQNVSLAIGSHTSFHPGRSADVLINGEIIGTFGELHPLVAQQFKLTHAPIMVAELDGEALLRHLPARHGIQNLPITPSVLEDIALVVSESTTAQQLEDVIRKAGGKLLKHIQLFDVYRGGSLPEGTKSLAYALTYQTDEKTLKDEDVAKVREKIIRVAERELGAKLRS